MIIPSEVRRIIFPISTRKQRTPGQTTNCRAPGQGKCRMQHSPLLRVLAPPRAMRMSMQIAEFKVGLCLRVTVSWHLACSAAVLQCAGSDRCQLQKRECSVGNREWWFTACCCWWRAMRAAAVSQHFITEVAINVTDSLFQCSTYWTMSEAVNRSNCPCRWTMEGRPICNTIASLL